MDAYTEAYSKLNEKQKEAVDAIEGPVMVIAGPGTGKTQILTLRIAHILANTDTDPSAILALTFTDAGVTAMRKRLKTFIGPDAYRVRIHTYHSFAESLVKEYGSYLPRLDGGVLVDEVDQREVLERAFDSVSVPKLVTRANPYRAMSEVVAFIQNAKRELFSPERLHVEYEAEKKHIESLPDFVHEKGAHKGKIKGPYIKALERIDKNLQATKVYEAYEKIMVDEGKYDFEDLLLDVVGALKKHEDFKRSVQEDIHYFLADEHQDANATQNELLLELADFHEEPNVFVVGDEKQAIYRFQGADLDTFLRLKDRYPSARVIVLDTNYRSTSEILDTAHALIEKAPIPDQSLRKRLVAHKGNGPTVSMCAAQTVGEELSHIVHTISKWHDEGAAYEDIAILVQKNADAFPVGNALSKANIPYTIFAREDLLSHPFTQLFFDLIRGILTGSPEALARGVFVPGVSKTNTERISYIEALRSGKPHPLKDLQEKITEYMRLHPASRSVPYLIQELGIVGGIASRGDGQELYEILEAILQDVERFAQVHRGATVEAYLARVDRIKMHGLSVLSRTKKGIGVNILTAHGSKGLEFPYVYIPFVNDARYGKKKGKELTIPGSYEQEEHDARRLLYVALTRAEKAAVLSYALKAPTGRDDEPSRFIQDIEILLENVAPEGKPLPLIAPHESKSLIDPAFIRERLAAYGISATAYGNYKSSPWKYFFKNILRLPESKGPTLVYGSAIHTALEEVGKNVFAQESIDFEKAHQAFISVVEKSDLEASDKEKLLQGAMESIQGYVTQATFGTEGKVEYDVSVPLEIRGVGEVVIRGKLDRIDILGGNAVRVIDYKTGRSKTEGEIRGTTQSSDGSYYVQLLFYALLLKHSDKDRFDMKEGVFEFVEKDPSGKYVSRAFTPSQKEVDAFEEELIADIADIANGAFFDAPVPEEYESLARFFIDQ